MIEKLIFLFRFLALSCESLFEYIDDTLISAILFHDHFDSERKLENTNARSAFIRDASRRIFRMEVSP